MAETPKPYGIVAEFETTADVLHAAEKVRDRGFRKWDVFTPFPIHGMDKAMGMKNSVVGWFSFIGGVTGYTSGMLMIWWMNAVDYPVNISGKPLFSVPASIPIFFELTVLFSALTAFFGTEGEQTPIGAPLYLGTDWKRHFGAPPAPVVGCLEALCAFRQVGYEIGREPPDVPEPLVLQAAPAHGSHAAAHPGPKKTKPAPKPSKQAKR